MRLNNYGILFAAFFALSLCGCSSNSKNDDDAQGLEPSKPESLSSSLASIDTESSASPLSSASSSVSSVAEEDTNASSSDAAASSISVSADENNNNTEASGGNTLAAEGVDTASIGTGIPLPYKIFREVASDQFIIYASDSSYEINEVLANYMEIDADILTTQTVQRNYYSLVFNEVTINLDIVIDSELYQYRALCPSGCEGLTLSRENRTMEFDSVNLVAVNRSAATGDIALSGTFSWSLIDELERETAIEEGEALNDSDRQIATIDDLLGVWDATIVESSGTDEVYYVFENDTMYVYDYLGDSQENGDNCYFRSYIELVYGENDSIGWRDSSGDVIYTTYYLYPDGSIRPDSELGLIFRSTELTVNDFEPLCELN